MNAKRIFSALLVAGMLAAPAFAKNHVAGIVQGNWGDNVYIGSQGRAYEVPVNKNAIFTVNGQQVGVESLAPGTYVEADGDIGEISEPQYGGYHSDEFFDNVKNSNR